MSDELPDQLRTKEEAVAFVRDFFAAGKPARRPDDLPAFSAKIVEGLAEGAHV